MLAHYITCWGNRHIAPNWGTADQLLRRSWSDLFRIVLRGFSWHRNINLFVNNTDYIKSKSLIILLMRNNKCYFFAGASLRNRRCYWEAWAGYRARVQSANKTRAFNKARLNPQNSLQSRRIFFLASGSRLSMFVMPRPPSLILWQRKSRLKQQSLVKELKRKK